MFRKFKATFFAPRLSKMVVGEFHNAYFYRVFFHIAAG